MLHGHGSHAVRGCDTGPPRAADGFSRLADHRASGAAGALPSRARRWSRGTANRSSGGCPGAGPLSAAAWQRTSLGPTAIGRDVSARRTPGADFNSIQLICGINCAALLIEHDMAPRHEGLLGDQQLAVGAADVQDLNVESPEIIVERIVRHRWLAPEQTMIPSSCGMNHLPRHIAFAKLQAITAAKRILSGRV